MAGFDIRSRFTGHPGRSTKTSYALRLKPDHSIGAGQCASPRGLFFNLNCPASNPFPSLQSYEGSQSKIAGQRAAFRRWKGWIWRIVSRPKSAGRSTLCSLIASG